MGQAIGDRCRWRSDRAQPGPDHRGADAHQPPGQVNDPAFVLGWLIGLGVVGAIVLSLAGSDGASESGAPAAWVSWVKIVLGVLLLLVAVRQFRGRLHGDEEPQMPKWLATIDKTTPVAAVGLAAVLSGANPKNLLLAVAGAAAIAGTGISGSQQALAYLVFALIGTLGVGIPVGIYFAMGATTSAPYSTRNWDSGTATRPRSCRCCPRTTPSATSG